MFRHQIACKTRDEQRIPESPPSRSIERLLPAMDQKDLCQYCHNGQVLCPLRNLESPAQNDRSEDDEKNYHGPQQKSSSRLQETWTHVLHRRPCIPFQPNFHSERRLFLADSRQQRITEYV